MDLVAAAVFLEQQRGTVGCVAGAADRFAGEGQLLALSHRGGNAVQLAGFGEAGGDQHRLALRVPVDETGGAIFHIGAGLVDDCLRNVRDLVSDQSGRARGDVTRFCRCWHTGKYR